MRTVVIAAVLAGSVTMITPAGVMAQKAGEPAAKLRFDIEAGPLTAVLRKFSESTGIQFVYSTPLASGLASPGVSGELTPSDALGRLLNGTGLIYRFTAPQTVTFEKADKTGNTRVLGPVRVEGAQQPAPPRGEGVAQLGGIRGGQDQEERGLRPVVAAVGAGSPTALEDIPRSVSVLTQTQIEAQDIQDFGEAIRRLPGLSMIERTSDTGSNAATGGGGIRARGFSVLNAQIDGGAPRNLDIINNGLSSLVAYERVELVRGPNGVFTGTGSPGGSLNLVRKRPGAVPTLDFTATGGSFGRRQALVDWSTPQIAGTALAFRSVASYEDQQFKWDNDHLKRGTLYGIMDAPLGERARLEVGAQYQNTRENGFYQSSYRYYDGPTMDLPFYFNYTPPWSFVDARVASLFSRFYVRLLDDWNFDFGLTYSHSDKRSLDSVINGQVNLLSNTKAAYQTCNAATGVCTSAPAQFFARENFYGEEILGTDFRVTGKFSTWRLDHDVELLGDFGESINARTELSRYDLNWPKIYTLADFASLPNFSAPNRAEGNVTYIDDGFRNSSSAYGLTVNDVVSWRQRIFLTLSARLQDQEASTGSVMRRRSDGARFDISPGELNSGNVNRDQKWRPSWALAVKPLREMTVYGSFSEGSTDQSTFFESDGKRLGPQTWDNAELGVKYGRFGWLLSTAGYRLKQGNVATQIPGTTGLCGPTPTSLCYFASGATVESKGYDVELSGRLFNRLDLQASYTTNETTTLKTSLPAETRNPDKLAKLFANWDVPWFPGLSLNLGAVYTGRVFQSGNRTIYDPVTFKVIDKFPFEYAESSTTIWDVGADYSLGNNIRVNLLLENAGNTEYYSTVASYAQHVGNPRTATLKVTWRDGGDRTGQTRSPSTGLAPFGSPSDWYGSLDIGQNDPGDWKAHSTGKGLSGETVRWNFETEARPAFAASLGYRLTNHWRTEFELGWRENTFGKVGGNGTVPYGLCSLDYAGRFVGTAQDRLTHCYDPQGEGVYWTLLGNVIRDFGAPEARVRPFVGVGLGATRASVDFSGRFDGYTDAVYRDWYLRTNKVPLPASTAVAPGEKVLGTDAAWGLSFQAIAGVSWRITDQATLDATYKYTRDRLDIRTANVTDYYPREFQSGNIPEPNVLVGSGLPQIGSFKGDLDSHVISLGFRWAFGVHQ